MKPSQRIQIFQDKYPWMGPVIWILSFQYFIAQIIAAHNFIGDFDWAGNFISDLGNTACGQYGGKYICSPDHMLMNTSFIVLGVMMALGSILFYQEFRESYGSLFGFMLMSLAGLGSMMVGLFTENHYPSLHLLGAALALFLGNVSIIVLSFALRRVRKSFRIYSLVSGVIALLALFLLAFYPNAFGLNTFIYERISSYTEILWLIFFGIYMSKDRFRRKIEAAI